MCFLWKKKNNFFKKLKSFQLISLKNNKIINKLLLTGAKLMLELHLKKSGFSYSACGSFI